MLYRIHASFNKRRRDFHVHASSPDEAMTEAKRIIIDHLRPKDNLTGEVWRNGIVRMTSYENEEWVIKMPPQLRVISND